MKFDSVVELVTNSSTSIYSFAVSPEVVEKFVQELMILTANGTKKLDVWVELADDYFSYLEGTDLLAELLSEPGIQPILGDDACITWKNVTAVEQYWIDSHFNGDRAAYFSWLMDQPAIADARADTGGLETILTVRRLDGSLDYSLFGPNKFYEHIGIANY